MTIKRFKDLRIWQQARAQVHAVYGSFGHEAPTAEGFGFREEIQKSAVSVMNNIAEGSGCRSDRDSARGLNMAKCFNSEVRSMLYLAEERIYVSIEMAREMRSLCAVLHEGVDSPSRQLREK